MERLLICLLAFAGLRGSGATFPGPGQQPEVDLVLLEKPSGSLLVGSLARWRFQVVNHLDRAVLVGAVRGCGCGSFRAQDPQVPPGAARTYEQLLPVAPGPQEASLHVQVSARDDGRVLAEAT